MLDLIVFTKFELFVFQKYFWLLLLKPAVRLFFYFAFCSHPFGCYLLEGLHEAVGPAVKLMFIVSVGIPVGVLCALISLSNAASHKIYIMIAGFLGCVGLTCILVFEHSSALLLTSMLITHMSGNPDLPGLCLGPFSKRVRATMLRRSCLPLRDVHWLFVTLCSLSIWNEVWDLGILGGDDLVRRVLSDKGPCGQRMVKLIVGDLINTRKWKQQC